MAEFMPVTASNHPKLKDHEAVEQLITGYYFDPDFCVGVGFDHDDGEPYLFMYGYVWPECWKLPAGVSADEFDAYQEGTYEEGADGLFQLLKELAPYLAEPLTVQAIGYTKCRFPLSAFQWQIEPGNQNVTILDFDCANGEPVLA